jgi:hypothetical protein
MVFNVTICLAASPFRPQCPLTVSFASQKCVVHDWTERFLRIEKHLTEAYQYYAGVKAPQWLLNGFAERLAYYSKQ